MKIIIGLGNPGVKYQNTRHNAGFMVLDKYAHEHGVDIDKSKFNALIAELRVGTEKVILVKPMTFMNNSGESVRQIVSFYKADLKDVLVVADDIEIELGMLRIRKKDGKGTHNGLKSIYQHLGSDAYPKMKLGVGKFMRDRDLADFVLAKIPEEDDSVIDDLIDRAVKAVDAYITQGIDIAMNRFNGKPV